MADRAFCDKKIVYASQMKESDRGKNFYCPGWADGKYCMAKMNLVLLPRGHEHFRLAHGEKHRDGCKFDMTVDDEAKGISHIDASGSSGTLDLLLQRFGVENEHTKAEASGEGEEKGVKKATHKNEGTLIVSSRLPSNVMQMVELLRSLPRDQIYDGIPVEWLLPDGSRSLPKEYLEEGGISIMLCSRCIPSYSGCENLIPPGGIMLKECPSAYTWAGNSLPCENQKSVYFILPRMSPAARDLVFDHKSEVFAVFSRWKRVHGHPNVYMADPTITITKKSLGAYKA